MPETVLLAFVAGLLAVDDRAGWQSLLAEPVFACVVVGAATGAMDAAVLCGVTLQLVWLTALPVRGTRRPNMVVGGVVGAGAAGLVLRHTGDPRTALVAATAVFCGLLAAEVGAVAARAAGEVRERWLEGVRLPPDPAEAARKLARCQAGSIASVAAVDAVLVLILLPAAVRVTESLTGWVGEAAGAGARRWIELLPVLGIVAVVRAYGTRASTRYFVVGMLAVAVVAWLR